MTLQELIVRITNDVRLAGDPAFSPTTRDRAWDRVDKYHAEIQRMALYGDQAAKQYILEHGGTL